MTNQSNLIESDIEAYLHQQEHKSCLVLSHVEALTMVKVPLSEDCCMILKQFLKII